jgi:rhodanese-related sulfurtransferase
VSKEKTLMDFVKAAKSCTKSISIEEVTTLQAEQHFGILDVREYEEYAEGTIDGAVNVPRGMLEAFCDHSYPSRRAEMQDRERPWLILCATGGRAAMAADVMQQMGFSDVRVIEGGIAAWKEAEKGTVIPPRHVHHA